MQNLFRTSYRYDFSTLDESEIDHTLIDIDKFREVMKKREYKRLNVIDIVENDLFLQPDIAADLRAGVDAAGKKPRLEKEIKFIRYGYTPESYRDKMESNKCMKARYLDNGIRPHKKALHLVKCEYCRMIVYGVPTTLEQSMPDETRKLILALEDMIGDLQDDQIIADAIFERISAFVNYLCRYEVLYFHLPIVPTPQMSNIRFILDESVPNYNNSVSLVDIAYGISEHASEQSFKERAEKYDEKK